MTYAIEVRNEEGHPIAAVRRRASLSELARVVPEACGEVWNFLRASRVEHPGRNVAVYFDGEGNLEVGVEVSEGFRSDGRVIASATPAGTVATTVHLGPYQRLSEPHAAIRKWCDDHHRTMAGPSWEIYGHWNDDPSKLRTDVFYLLKEEGEPAV
jgi:effector-binding domain-containing protein